MYKKEIRVSYSSSSRIVDPPRSFGIFGSNSRRVPTHLLLYLRCSTHCHYHQLCIRNAMSPVSSQETSIGRLQLAIRAKGCELRAKDPFMGRPCGAERVSSIHRGPTQYLATLSSPNSYSITITSSLSHTSSQARTYATSQ